LLSRRSSVFLAIIVGYSIGFLGGLLLVVISGEPMPAGESAALALAAGVAGVVGLGAFYYALSRGTMGIIAPLTAVIGAGVPVLFAVISGESVPPSRLFGICLALIAVVLVSLPGGEGSDSERRAVRIEIRELPWIVVSGLGFAGFFIFIDRATASGETWWPLTLTRMAGLTLVFVSLAFVMLWRTRDVSLGARAESVLGLARLRDWSVPRSRLILLLLVTGLADFGGNVFFVLASQSDALSVAVVLSSLYPVVTTVLAAIILHERLRRRQIVGVGLAAVSVPLMR
jgi:drug/metabolite transporter (DMT)-like permease